jgi:hypothetical protein
MSAEISKVKKIIWIKDTTEVTPTIITLIQFMAGPDIPSLNGAAGICRSILRPRMSSLGVDSP